jgi:hypothetical protein
MMILMIFKASGVKCLYAFHLQRIVAVAVHKGTALLAHRIKAMHSWGKISGSIF